MPLVPGGINIPAIIESAETAAADATIQRYDAATAAAAALFVDATAPSAHVLYLLKLLHLRFICGVLIVFNLLRGLSSTGNSAV